jgi:hypothetical protein
MVDLARKDMVLRLMDNAARAIRFPGALGFLPRTARSAR